MSSDISQIGETRNGYVLTQNGWVPTKPPKKKRTFLKVFLALCAFGIVSVIALVVLLSLGANEVSKSIDQNNNKPGGANNPMAITPGKAFAVDDFNYAAGWKITKDVIGNPDVTGLKVTNNRQDKDSAIVQIKLWKGSEVLAVADCTTEPIMPGTTTSLMCTSADKLPTGYTKVTINDTF